MPAMVPQHIFRHDGENSRKGKGPEKGGTYEHADADTGDVCTGDILFPLPVHQSGKDQFRHNAGSNGYYNRTEAFQDPKAEMPHKQDQADEDGGSILELKDF